MSLWQLTLQIAFSNRAYSQMSLRQLTLAIAFRHQSLQQKELSAAYATDELERTALTLSSLQQKELAWLKAIKPASSTRASDDQLDALASSTRASEEHLDASASSTRALEISLQQKLPTTCFFPSSSWWLVA